MQIIDSAIDFYLEVLEEALFVNKEERTEKEYNQIYTYWCMCSLKMKKELLLKYKEIFENITSDVDVLKKNDSGYENMKIDFKQVVSDLNDMVTIKNLSAFMENKAFKESVNIKLIEEMLETQGVAFSIVVVDKNFTEVLSFPYAEKVAVVSAGDEHMYLTVHTVQEDKFPRTLDGNTKNYLLSSLLKRNKSKHRYSIVSPSMRRYIIGIAEYDTICTSTVPFGVDGEWYPSIGYIIAPFTIKQWENHKHLPVGEFEKTICESKGFQNLINYTFEHQVQSGKHSMDDIRKRYIDLIKELYSIGTKLQ